MGFWFNMNYMVFLCFPWTPTNFYDSGPPITDDICENMLPNHNLPGPEKDIEFIFSEDVCYNLGSSINVTISKVGNAKVGYVFNGIMIQAKAPGVADKNYGSFDPIDSKRFKTATCFRKQRSAIHQITKLQQTNLTFYWTAPTGDDNVGDLEFRVTVVFPDKFFKNDLKIPLPICTNAGNSTEGHETSRATTAPTPFNPATTLKLITSTLTTPTTGAVTATATATPSTRTVRKFNTIGTTTTTTTTKSEKCSMSSLSVNNSATKIKQLYIVGSLSQILLILLFCSTSVSKLY